jgi:hypothetical protein
MSTQQRTTLAKRENGDQRMVAADPIKLGEVLAASGYFEDAADAAKAAVKVMAGQELGFGPIASMTGVHIIEGKPSVGANLLAALVKRSKTYRYEVRTLTDQECSIAIFEKRGGKWVELSPTSDFSIKDAERIKFRSKGNWRSLTEKANWRFYPRNMLFARALSNAVTFHCPDLTSGAPIYTPDELGAEVDGATGEIVDAAAREPEPESQPERAAITAEQAEGLEAMVDKAGLTPHLSMWLRGKGAESVGQLTAEEGFELLSWARQGAESEDESDG